MYTITNENGFWQVWFVEAGKLAILQATFISKTSAETYLDWLQNVSFADNSAFNRGDNSKRLIF